MDKAQNKTKLKNLYKPILISSFYQDLDKIQSELVCFEWVNLNLKLQFDNLV